MYRIRSAVIVFFIVLIVSVWFINNLYETARTGVPKNILSLRSNNQDELKEAIEFLMSRPVDNLPYLIAELSNEQILGVDSLTDDSCIQYQPPYRNTVEKAVLGGEKVNDLILDILELLSVENIRVFSPKAGRIEWWRSWYGENYPYLYRDRPWLEIDHLAKQCGLDTFKWIQISSQERSAITQEIFDKKDKECLAIGLSVHRPKGETESLIDQLTNITNNYRYSQAKEKEIKKLVSAIACKGDESIPSLMYVFNRNFSFVLKEVVVVILSEIHTDLSDKVLLKIFNGDEPELLRHYIFCLYTDQKRKNWQEVLMTEWLNGLKNDRLWKDVSMRNLRLHKNSEGIDKVISFLIEGLDTDDPEMRRYIARRLWVLTGRFVVKEESPTGEFSMIEVSRKRPDEKMIDLSVINISQQQLQIVIKEWKKWWQIGLNEKKMNQ